MSTYQQRRDEIADFVDECVQRMTEIVDEAETRDDAAFIDGEQAEFDQLNEWVTEGRSEVDDLNARIEVLNAAQDPINRVEEAPRVSINVNKGRAEEIGFDALTRGMLSPAEVRDSALATIERGGKRFGTDPDGLAKAEGLARKGEAFARHIATFGQDVYAEAWAKRMSGKDFLMSETEARALAVGTATSAGSLVPTHLDPSIIATNSGSYNPFRRIGRVVTLPNPGPNSWNGVTSAGVTAAWLAEATEEAGDDAPATVQSAIPTYKGSAWVPASVESLEDVAGLAGEVQNMFVDAKDRLESAAFATGSGSAQPTGILTQCDANTQVEVANTTAATLGLVDLHAALNGLSARFRDRATWVMSPTQLGTIQQLGTAVSASFTTDAAANYTGQLLGRPVELSSSMPGTPSATTTVENWLVVGDFGQFIIVDKIGMSTQFIPFTMGANQRPDGGVGWWTHWRTGSEATYTGDATTTRAFVLLQDITSA